MTKNFVCTVISTLITAMSIYETPALANELETALTIRQVNDLMYAANQIRTLSETEEKDKSLKLREIRMHLWNEANTFTPNNYHEYLVQVLKYNFVREIKRTPDSISYNRIVDDYSNYIDILVSGYDIILLPKSEENADHIEKCKALHGLYNIPNEIYQSNINLFLDNPQTSEWGKKAAKIFSDENFYKFREIKETKKFNNEELAKFHPANIQAFRSLNIGLLPFKQARHVRDLFLIDKGFRCPEPDEIYDWNNNLKTYSYFNMYPGMQKAPILTAEQRNLKDQILNYIIGKSPKFQYPIINN